MTTKFGKKSTAEEVLAGLPAEAIVGKNIIVTGGNGGIGLETVRCLANAGAHVMMTSRSVDAGEKALESIQTPDMKGKVTVHALDLGDFDSIKAFADTVTAVDILICNAGVNGISTPTKQGFEQQIGVNHIGHVYLTQLLLPKLKASGSVDNPSRVVVVASFSYAFSRIDVDDLNWEKRKPNPGMAYGDSKLANMLFARELAKRMKAENAPVLVVSLHPGLISTGLLRNAGVMGAIVRFVSRFLGKDIPQGAATTVYAAAANVNSGSYYEDCTETVPKPHALDDELALKLWDKTEELIAKALNEN